MNNLENFLVDNNQKNLFYRIGSHSSYMECYEINNGIFKAKWVVQLHEKDNEKIQIVQDKNSVYILSDDLTAYSKENGRELWRKKRVGGRYRRQKLHISGNYLFANDPNDTLPNIYDLSSRGKELEFEMNYNVYPKTKY